MGQNEARKCHSTHPPFGEIVFQEHRRYVSNAPTSPCKLSLSQSESHRKPSDQHPSLTSNGKRSTLLYPLTRTRKSYHQHQLVLSNANVHLRRIYHPHTHTRYNVQLTDPPTVTHPRMVCICTCSPLRALTLIRSYNPHGGGGGSPTKHGHSCCQR